EGLGIFGGVATTEATDDPPPHSHGRPPGQRPQRSIPPAAAPAPGRPPGSAAPAAGAGAAAGGELQPSRLAGLLGVLRGGTPVDEGEPRMSVRDLPPDIQVRFWRIRLIIMVAVGAAFAALTRSWEVALTLAILAGIIDTVYRSRNAANYRNGPQPGARRRTSKQLARMRREGYFSVEGRHIPGSPEIIDHLVVGPSGVYAIDSEKWDAKLPIRTLNGKRLYLGPESQKERLEHAAWEASQASAVLSQALGAEIPVRPALAVYGPKIPWDIATIRNVDVFTGSALRKYLKRRGRRKDGVVLLTREEVRTIYDTAARLLPDGAASSNRYTPVG
ncbi:MAG TPA: nuclease-related domain-containing protein, partial [Trebonia sp.]